MREGERDRTEVNRRSNKDNNIVTEVENGNGKVRRIESR